MYNDIIKCYIFFYRDSFSLSNFQIVFIVQNLRKRSYNSFTSQIDALENILCNDKECSIFVFSSYQNTVLYRLIVVNSKASLFFLLFPFLLFFFQSLILPFCNLQIPPSPPISFFFPSLPFYFSSLYFIYSLQLYP